MLRFIAEKEHYQNPFRHCRGDIQKTWNIYMKKYIWKISLTKINPDKSNLNLGLVMAPLLLMVNWSVIRLMSSLSPLGLTWSRIIQVKNVPTRFHESRLYPDSKVHSGETDETNCSWLHPVWPPPKRPDQDSTFCVISRTSTELIFCIHRDFDVRNNVYKPRRLVCQCCRDISAWKSRVMKPTVLRDPGRMKPTEHRDEANWFSNWTDEANCW